MINNFFCSNVLGICWFGNLAMCEDMVLCKEMWLAVFGLSPADSFYPTATFESLVYWLEMVRRMQNAYGISLSKPHLINLTRIDIIDGHFER